MDIPILRDILIILGLGVLVLFIFSRLRIPPIVGFLLTGLISGPYGFSLVSAVHDVEIMAEIGVILLLFSLGLEFSLNRLLELKRPVLNGGPLQVGLTIGVVFGVARYLGSPVSQSLFMGFLVSLSSTAIVLKILQEQSTTATPHGNISVGILIFQDIIVVPMMLLLPFLAGMEKSSDVSALPGLIGKLLVLLVVVYIGSKWVVPRALHHIAQTRSRELFLMSVAFLALAVAWLTSFLGLSLALGAFLAGLIVSESEYSHQAFADILPFRDIFMSFFFVSVGMLLDIRTILEHPGLIGVIVVGVIFLKFTLTGGATLLIGYPLRTAMLVGLGLAQIGEFSFILSEAGLRLQLITGIPYQIFLAVSVISMMMTPFLTSLDKFIEKITFDLPLPERLKKGKLETGEIMTPDLQDHVVIIGYGINGRNLSRAARAAHIPFLVVELNPDTVRRQRDEGMPVFYGDANHPEVLRQSGIRSARVLVVTINDAAATRRITRLARQLNPGIHVIARTRFVQEVAPLFEAGANQVIPEEFETSIEIFTRVLQKYLVPENRIAALHQEIRASGYQMLRSRSWEQKLISDLELPRVETSRVKISSHCAITGQKLSELALPRRYGINLLVIFREGKILHPLHGNTIIQGNDELLILGIPENITKFLAEIGKI